ncbi:MAG: hypothetical protein HPY59_17545 [Anaerolineae bacterium]|nr:hypothetical protein [Anaerolineae bacterium]
MAVKKAYQQWRDLAAKAQQIETDPDIALWQKVFRVPGVYCELDLSGLRSKDRHQIFNILGQLNVILKRYEPETFEEYQNMDEKDLREMLRLVKGQTPARK